MTSVTDLLSGLGVNTHVDATATSYGYPSLIANSLAYLGFTLIRDHAYNIDLPAYQALVQDDPGLRFDLIADGHDPQAELNAMAPLGTAVASFEGANEVDIYPVENAHGSNLVTPAIAEQQLLYSEVKSTAVFAKTPVLNESIGEPSDYNAYLAALASSDVTNVHAYAAGATPPMQAIAPVLQLENVAPNKPVEITETGYFTLATDPDGVDQVVQAKYTLDTLLDDAKLGVTATFLYELFDEGADPTGTDDELHYGLFNADGTPKLAATAIHNFTSILRQPLPAGGAPLAISPSVSGLPSTGNWLQLGNGIGPAVITVWAEPNLWNPATEQEISVSATPVTVNLGTTAASVSVFDPTVASTPIATYANASQVVLGVTDHPLIIEAAGLATHYATLDVYRFFDTEYGTHFYSDSTSEKNAIVATRPDLVYEGVGLLSVDPASGDPNVAPVFRFFDTHYGTHFFTASASERDTIIKTRADLTYEGIGFYEHTTAQAGDVAVYRFFDQTNGTHFYTNDANERASVIATRPDLVSEGIGFYAPTT